MKKISVLLSLLALMLWGWTAGVLAATATVESDNDAIAASSTPEEDSANAMITAEDSNMGSGEPKRSMTSHENNDVNFNYFLTSGYAADDIRNIPAVGHVEGTSELDGSLSTAKTIYVKVTDDKIVLDPGTKLIAFGDGGALVVKKANFHKQFIKNLAILRVREQAGKQRYLVDVVNSYDFIPEGAPVKLYDGEKALWDKVQIAKTPSSKAIKCYVAGGERGRDAWNQLDYIILTAGSKQGVTEGTEFQLFEITYNKEDRKERDSRGWGKIFYVGSSYSLAQIENGSDSIQAGFEAVYQP